MPIKKLIQQLARKITLMTLSFVVMIFIAQPMIVFGLSGSNQPSPNCSNQPSPNCSNQPDPNTSIQNPLADTSGKGINNLCDLISAIINVITYLGGIVAVLFIIWSGFLFIKAQGNPKEIQAAKSTFYTTIIGTAILLGASVIAKIIFNTISKIVTVPGGVCGS